MFEFITIPGAPEGANKLRLYKYFSNANNKTMLVVPGFNGYLEFYEIFFQMLVGLGFNVISFEYRSSGLSDNFTKKFGHHHLETPQTLYDDLEAVFNHIPVGQNLYMVGVSFGGVTGFHFLANSPSAHYIRKVVLLAPMIQFLTNKWPYFLARWYAKLGARICPERTVYKNYDQGLYDAEQGFSLTYMNFYEPTITRMNTSICGSCPLQIENSLKVAEYYKDQPNTTSILTYNTLNILFHLTDTLPDPGTFSIPVLLFTAGKEFYVDSTASIKYGLKMKNCTLIHLPQARHGLILETPEVFKVMEQNIKLFIEDDA